MNRQSQNFQKLLSVSRGVATIHSLGLSDVFAPQKWALPFGMFMLNIITDVNRILLQW